MRKSTALALILISACLVMSSCSSDSGLVAAPTISVSTATTVSQPTEPPTKVAFAVSPTPTVKPGLYVTNLRTDPNPPLRGSDINFYVTFLNATGVVQNYKWIAYLYRTDNPANRFGETTRTDSSIPVGGGEFKSLGSFKIPVGGPCEDYTVRINFFDQDNKPIQFAKPDGQPFQKDIHICAMVDISNYPTPSPLPPTLTPTPSAGVYAIDLRIQPDPPVRNTDLNFIVTFANTTGNPLSYKWVVYIHRPGDPNSFGQTTGATSLITSAIADSQSAGSWKLSGGGPCEDFVARVSFFDQQNKAVPFMNFDNKPFEKPFKVCPP